MQCHDRRPVLTNGQAESVNAVRDVRQAQTDRNIARQILGPVEIDLDDAGATRGDSRATVTVRWRPAGTGTGPRSAPRGSADSEASDSCRGSCLGWVAAPAPHCLAYHPRTLFPADPGRLGEGVDAQEGLAAGQPQTVDEGWEAVDVVHVGMGDDDPAEALPVHPGAEDLVERASGAVHQEGFRGGVEEDARVVPLGGGGGGG